MSSRDAILKAVAAAEGVEKPLPQVYFASAGHNVLAQFSEVLRTIGGAVLQAESREAAIAWLQQQFADAKKIVFAGELSEATDPHTLADVDLAILDSQIGVAENGAIWITDENLPQRALPFIAQHLAVLLPAAGLVPTMGDAYKKIGAADYGFSVFIAGPSKTADIEQSLVLGAHGARTMLVILV